MTFEKPWTVCGDQRRSCGVGTVVGNGSDGAATTSCGSTRASADPEQDETVRRRADDACGEQGGTRGAALGDRGDLRAPPLAIIPHYAAQSSRRGSQGRQ